MHASVLAIHPVGFCIHQAVDRAFQRATVSIRPEHVALEIVALEIVASEIVALEILEEEKNADSLRGVGADLSGMISSLLIELGPIVPNPLWDRLRERRERHLAITSPFQARMLVATDPSEWQAALEELLNALDELAREPGDRFTLTDEMGEVLRATREEIARLSRNPDEASLLYLLAGMLRTRGIPADRILRQHGLTLSKLRPILRRIEGNPTEGDPNPDPKTDASGSHSSE